MHNELQSSAAIPPMTHEVISKVSSLEDALLSEPQLSIHTSHVLHGGVYLRTIQMPYGAMLTGALIKVPTTLIVSGSITVYTGGDRMELKGYSVVPASAGRKQVMYANEKSDLTMLFKTDALTVEDAEMEFTDEHSILGSHHGGSNSFIVTGE